MVSSNFATTASAIGMLWRRHRRCLPRDVSLAYIKLLQVIQPYFRLDRSLDVKSNLASSREDVYKKVDILLELATPHSDNVTAAQESVSLNARNTDRHLETTSQVISLDTFLQN